MKTKKGLLRVILALIPSIITSACFPPIPPQPKYTLSVAKTRAGIGSCRLELIFTNTRQTSEKFWIKYLLLDDAKNTLDEKIVSFDTTLPGKTNHKENWVRVECSRIRDLVVTANTAFVEPTAFGWKY